MKQKFLLKTLLLLCALVAGSGTVWGNEGDELAICQGTGSGYGTRRTLTDSHSVGWVLASGQTGYLGANNATNHNKVIPTAADLPVVKAVNSDATTTTTGYYFYYTTTPVANVGSIEFSYTGNNGNSSATAYVVVGDALSESGGDAYEVINLSSTSTTAQNASLGTSGTFTYTFNETQTDARYYGFIIVTNSYKRLTAGTIKLKEGATGNTPVCATPTFSPAAGAVVSGTEVSISSTEGATIYYTINGTNPTSSSSVYSSPIEITAATTIKAFASMSGYNDSEVATATYTIKPTVSGYTIDFENDVDAYVDWEMTNVGIHSSIEGVTAHGGSAWGVNANNSGNAVATASIATKKTIEYPGTFTCYVSKESNNTTASSWKVQVSSDGSSWNDVAEQSATSMTKGSWVEFTANLSGYSDVYVRLYYSGSNAFRTVDDISITMRDPNTKITPTVTINATGITTTDIAGNTNVAAGTLAATVASGETNITTPAVTWSSSDTGVATVNATSGAVTLIAVGTTTITATFAGNDDYTEATNTYELTVIDSYAKGQANNPYTVAEAIEATPASGTSANVYIRGIVSAFYNTSIIGDGNNYRYYISDDGTTTTQLLVYKGKGLNETAFDSDDDLLVGDIVTICGGLTTYSNAPEVASGNYIYSLQRQKTDPTIVVNATETVAYGSTFTVDDTMIEGGNISVSSSNTAVATVSGLVITPVAVGTTTITVATAENASYNPGSETFELTVTAPTGQTTAPTGTPASTIFEETFADCAGIGEAGSFSGTGNAAITSDNSGWTFVKANAANGCGKFGSGSADGSAKTPEITVVNGNTYTLTFKAAPWSTEDNTQMNVSVEGGTITGISTDVMETQVWNEYEATITATSTSVQILFAATAHRFFLDDVKVEAPASLAPAITATLNGSGYATFCSQYPLDFSGATDYSAWQVTGVSDSKVTFEKITGSIKGGQGILLKGTANETITLTSANSETVLNTNELVGTTAPMYVADDSYYGLSGNQFVKVNAGTVKVGKALLPASVVGTPARLSFVFEDETTTGINNVNVNLNDNNVYDLSGRRVAQPAKGLYIVNGKKVVIK